MTIEKPEPPAEATGEIIIEPLLDHCKKINDLREAYINQYQTACEQYLLGTGIEIHTNRAIAFTDWHRIVGFDMSEKNTLIVAKLDDHEFDQHFELLFWIHPGEGWLCTAGRPAWQNEE